MTDALVKLLNNLGYLPVFLPRTGIVPPEVYNLANGYLVRRGPLANYFLKGTPAPPTKRGKLANIEHKQTSGKKMREAISFLGDALRCIGITSPPKLDLSFSGSTEFTFSFTDVAYEAVDPSALDAMIRTLATGAIPRDYVEAGKLHIAYEYAYAHTLLMRRADSRAFEHDITGIKIGTYVDLGSSGKAEAQSETTIAFKNSSGARAAFAYKAGRLAQKDGRWEFYPEEVMRRGFVATGGAGANKQPFLPARGVVLAMSEDRDGGV